MTGSVESRVDGPVIDQASQEHRYTVLGEPAICFSIVPEGDGWAVRIDGLPEPSISHDHPWESVDEARDAAIRVVADLQKLELMQREDQRQSSP
jgi:hypothetical protein